MTAVPAVLRGAALTAGCARLLAAARPGGVVRWERRNYRGAPVTLLPGLALGLALGSTSAPAAVAGLGACTAGAYDDLAGQRADQRSAKGVRGHAAALRRGQLTGGVVKVLGIGLAGTAAAVAGGRRSAVDVALAGALVAATANLLNLLDLRPGRALKAGLAAALALRQPVAVGAILALLPGDLGERTMLGDAGANALGAVLGVALADRLPDRRQGGLALAGLVALTAASEVVSYSAVIDATPALRALDRLGRLPA